MLTGACWRGGVLRGALVAALCALFAAAGRARGQGFDVRSMAMGGVAVYGSGSLPRLNPAYRAVPRESRDAPRVWAVPAGLAQAAAALSDLDVENDAFDPLRVVEYALHIPIALELLDPDDPVGRALPPGGGGVLAVRAGDLQAALPAEGFHLGALQRCPDVGLTVDLGRARGVFHLAAVEAFAHNQVGLALDDGLRSLVSAASAAGADPAGRGYLDALVQAGFSTGLAYARELPLPRADSGIGAGDDDWMEAWWDADWRRLRAWGGLAYRRLFGLGLAHLQGDAGFTATGLQTAGHDSLLVAYEALYTSASAEHPFDWAGGEALDAGVVLRWRDLELGAAVADLLADVTWDGARRDRLTYDAQRTTLQKERVAEDVRLVEDVSASWLVNGAWTRGAWLVAADLAGGPGGSRVHAGAEWWRTPRLALRAGVELDQRQLMQGGVGIGLRGLRGSHVGLDVAISCHSPTLDGARGLSLGLALVLD